MFEVAYSLFAIGLFIEVLVFLLLNLPTPKGWKGKIVKFLTSNKHMKIILKAQIALCLMACVFLADSYRLQNKYRLDKQAVKAKDSYASELKYQYLSFMTLKVQRNEYITFMLIYAAIALTAYLWVLDYMYEKRQKYEESLKKVESALPAERKSEVTVQSKGN